MNIISFYSHKDGAGRTQLLANIAARMCIFNQKRILIIDCDLDAPDLDYYLKIDRKNIKKGVINVFENYTDYCLKNKSNKIKAEYLPFFDQSYILKSPLFNNDYTGTVDYIPACSYNDPNWHTNAQKFEWYNFYHIQGGNVFVEFLKQKLKELPYDFILIDSKKGISDYTLMCNIQLADVNVVVVPPNEQNMKGAKEMTDRIVDSPYMQVRIDNKPLRQPIILPILSKLDLSIQKESDKWRQKMNDTFGKLIANTLTLLNQKTNTTQYIKKTSFPYNTKMTYGTQISLEPHSLKIETILQNHSSFAKQNPCEKTFFLLCIIISHITNEIHL